MTVEMLQPRPWWGTCDQIPFDDFAWLRGLSNTYAVLWDISLNQGNRKYNFPIGYKKYIVQCAEQIDLDWLHNQAIRLPDSEIIVINAGDHYNYNIDPNVKFYPYYVWHFQLEKIKSWNPTPQPKDIKYKVSVICNRVTQSKLWTFTASAKYLEEDNCLLKLGNWLEEKNVHNREYTGNMLLDNLSDCFWDKYWGHTYEIDSFDNQTQNYQRHTSNLDSRHLREAAINITNESFHYSYMENNGRTYVWPGPFLSEKTLSCLAGGTAFLSAGQFEVYKTLSSLGLRFDYGNIDLSWDLESKNLIRFEGLVNTIAKLKDYDVDEIYQMTHDSTIYNHDQIWSGNFYQHCQHKNEQTIAEVLS